MSNSLRFMSPIGPCIFYIYDCPQKCDVTGIIHSMLGVVTNDATVEYAISLAAPDFDPGTNEVYSINYIQECRRRNLICSLVNFRLNKITCFSNQFDPLIVLMRQCSWSKARRKYGVVADVMPPALQGSCDGGKSQGPTKKPLDQAKPAKKNLIFNIDWSAKNLPAIPFPEEVNAAKNSVQSTCVITQATAAKDKDQTAEPTLLNNGPRSSLPEAVAGPSGLCRRDYPPQTATKRFLDRTENSGPKEKLLKVTVQPSKFYKNHNANSIWVHKSPSKTLSQKGMVTKEDRSILGSTSVHAPASGDTTNSASQPAQDKSNKSNRHPVFLSGLETSSSSNVSGRKPKRPRPKRREYTPGDKSIILAYVMDQKGYSKVKGVAFWKRMEEDKVLPGRTWQSLKEHFLKQILPNIERYKISACALKEFNKITG